MFYYFFSDNLVILHSFAFYILRYKIALNLYNSVAKITLEIWIIINMDKHYRPLNPFI